MSRTPSPPTEVELWLAQRIVGANELLMVGRDDLKGAQSAITSSCRGSYGGGTSSEVKGDKVNYFHPEHGTGMIKLRRLLEVARLYYTDAKHQRLFAAYRLYTHGADLARRHHYGEPRTPERVARADAAREVSWAASDALALATRRWWEDVPDDPFVAALMALHAARTETELEQAGQRYASVWVAEHVAFAELRRLQVERSAA